jgi:hypothetical protein
VKGEVKAEGEETVTAMKMAALLCQHRLIDPRDIAP